MSELPKTRTLSVRVSEPASVYLAAVAAAEHCTVGDLLRRALALTYGVGS